MFSFEQMLHIWIKLGLTAHQQDSSVKCKLIKVQLEVST